MGAEKLFAISNVPGVLRDPDDAASRIAQLGPAEIEAAIAEGSISGGMIAKLEEALRAVRQGVQQVIVAGPAEAGLVARALRGAAGTVIRRDR
jgi:acetylglutamate kinase